MNSPDFDPSPRSEPQPPARRPPLSPPATDEAADAWIESVLRDGLDSYLDDDGFTARVTAQLPAARPRPVWLRPLVLGTGACAGVLLSGLAARQIDVVQGTDSLLRQLGFLSRPLRWGALDLDLTGGQALLLAVCAAMAVAACARAWRTVLHF